MLPHLDQILRCQADVFAVHAEIPGVSKEEVHVTLDGNTVTLSTEIKQIDNSSKDEKILRSERYFGSVARSFQLAQDIEREGSKAKFENGVLTLTLAKKKMTTSNHQIAID